MVRVHRICANPDEPNYKKRHILREDIHPVEAEHGESVGSMARNWTARGIKPVAATQWWPADLDCRTLTPARLAGLLEWQGTSTDRAMAGHHRYRHP